MRRSFALVPPLILASVLPALAQDEGGGLLDVNTGLTIWTWIIFLIVLGVLWKFAFPQILGAVEERERRLQEMMDSAEQDRARAAALVEENRAELEQSRAQAHEILAESRAAAERAREEMLVQTRREQEAILERAQREIRQERDRAVDAVRQEAVEVAIAAAEKLLGRNLTAQDNRRLVMDYLEELEQGEHAAVPSGA